MYDIDSLASDGVVRVAATRFPVTATLDSSGQSPTRFSMVQIPGTDPPQWVAVVWTSNQLGGTPNLAVAESVTSILAFNVQNIHLVLNTGSNLVITPSRGCGCGSLLKSYRGWPNARLSSVPAPQLTT